MKKNLIIALAIILSMLMLCGCFVDDDCGITPENTPAGSVSRSYRIGYKLYRNGEILVELPDPPHRNYSSLEITKIDNNNVSIDISLHGTEDNSFFPVNMESFVTDVHGNRQDGVTFDYRGNNAVNIGEQIFKKALVEFKGNLRWIPWGELTRCSPADPLYEGELIMDINTGEEKYRVLIDYFYASIYGTNE